MLAKPPLYLPRQLSQRFPVPQNSQLLRLDAATRWSKPRFSIRCGYTKKSIGTPGAYQLIDDESGEKFIVWGGVENDEAPIPSKEVLSWKADSEHLNRTRGAGVKLATIDADGDQVTPSKGTLASSFGRLKIPRIKALTKKSPRIKQESADNRRGLLSEEILSDDANSSDSEVEFTGRKANESSVGYSERFQAKDTWNEEKVTETNGYDFRQVSSLEPTEQDFKTTKLNDSVPKRISSLRGWSPPSRQRGMADFGDPFKKEKQRGYEGGFFSRKLFKELGCNDDMIKSLMAQNFLRPSHIQAMAYMPVLEGKSCVIADQSGSGKTLAYLAPVIQHMREEELQGFSKSAARHPRVVILVPTAELASQVLNNCRSISKYGVPFRSMVATGGFRQKTQLDSLKQDLDVLIATPGRFMFLLSEGFLELSNLKCAVLDEVDILFGDEEFEKVLQILLDSAPVTTQYLFVTATLPIDIYNKLVEAFPDCEVIMGPGVHRTSSRLEEILVDCSGGDSDEKTSETAFMNKKSALLRLVEENPVPKTIIFCNKIETCRRVENVLKRLDRKETRMRVLPFHAALGQEVRLANMKEFVNSQSDDSLFLICTDRASRGIDFANVDHVVLFDFPRDPSEYVRRVGRTARGAGGKGKAFVFVVGKQVSLARRIIERNLKGHPLHDVPTAYELSASAL
ncbi:DEAD-box ATP-dependent RNA helicase 50 [Aristolochia californica]|uniref:DEAD-box ATP-dependent RNA helicase 50 n=1 Tax=Aristolochia californica TaxID=171875 RepID=UPI0035D5D38B